MNLWKPYFIHRPSQIVRRLLRGIWQPESAVVTLPWGTPLRISPREAIGKAIWLTGVHEIATTEAIFRLLPKGGVGVDVGANLGYMTSAMLAAAGEMGTVIACEPHPVIFDVLQSNISLVRPSGKGVKLLNLAASEQKGEAMLSFEPDSENQGTGTLNSKSGMHQTKVLTDTLDALTSGLKIDLLKLDVEGHELSVLKGATQLFLDKRLQNIVYEDHLGSESTIHPWLASVGYTVFQLLWTVNRPILAPPGTESRHARYQAQDYIASLDPDSVVQSFVETGWRCLG